MQARDFPIVDAHQHFWEPERNYHPWLNDEPMIPFRYGDYTAIRSRFLPPDYMAATGGWKVAKTVYVETEWDHRDPLGETRYIHKVAAEFGVPNAVVAQAWLDSENARDLIVAQAAFPLVRSVRHKPRAAASAALAQRGARGSMDDPRWRDGFAHLAPNHLMFDLQTPWWHLDAAADLAGDFPSTTIVLNHAGLPSDRSVPGLAAWRSAMEHLARAPNVMLKISGIGLADRPWRAEDNIPVVRDAISIFGAERCMFASNFPVDSLIGDFNTIFSGFAQATASMPWEVQRGLFHDNACRVYQL